MKTTSLLLGVLLVISTFSGSASADNKRKVGSGTVMSEYRAPAADGVPGFGIGFASFGSAGMPAAALGALSTWINFNGAHSLQPFFGMTSSSPFAFGGGAVYRATILGNYHNGFHIGGGFNLGTAAAGAGTAFFCNIFPAGGAHFTILNNMLLSFDGGLIFHVTPSPFQFSALPLSDLLGASIHYFF